MILDPVLPKNQIINVDLKKLLQKCEEILDEILPLMIIGIKNMG